jgi:uncharacterized protein
MASGDQATPDSGATVLISQRVYAGREHDYLNWQEKLDQAARGYPGFVATEIQPPHPEAERTWTVVYRFATISQLKDWLGSETRQDFQKKGSPMFDGPVTEDILAGEAPERDIVTAVVSHRVRPGREDEFMAWQDRVEKAEEKFPGFMGSELFKPVPGVQENWVVLFRFDTQEHLRQWMDSETRQKLLKEGEQHVASYDVRQIGSSFSGWFRFADQTTGRPPPNWKQALSVVLALYPTVMFLNLTLGRALLTAGLPGYISLFIGNVFSVSILTWLLMPLVNRVFSFWLAPARRDGIWINIVGTACVVACFIFFIVFFGLVTGFK